METVTFSKSAIFDGKVRKPGMVLTVSDSEMENLDRVGVIVEAIDGIKNNDLKIKPETNFHPENELDIQDINQIIKPDYSKMSKKELQSELIKRKLQPEKASKAKMRKMIDDFDKKQLNDNNE